MNHADQPTASRRKIMKRRLPTSVIKKTLLLALLLLTGSAWAEWVRVGESKNYYQYIDPATIRKDGNLFRVWEISDLKTRSTDGDLSRRIRYEYDCKQERIKLLSFSTHSGPMANGTTLLSDSSDGEWLHIPPGSIGESVLKIVCAK